MSTNTQYHHYIPRFILRRWAVDVAQSSDAPNKIGMKPEHLNVYSLDQDTLQFGTETISRSFGLVDMYKDTTHAQDAYHIEKSLSGLEQAASKVISKLDTATLAGSVTLLRSEVNTLRKFVFVMSLRNGRQYRRWMHEELEGQTMEILKKFMADHGLASTRDAYLLTIRHLLDSEHWEVEHDPKIFSVTRDDYQCDKDKYSLVFYAAPPGVEFIVSESAFGIWQGIRPPWLHLAFQIANPSIKMTDGHSLICTKLFPVTPKLAFLLRSHHMRREDELLKQGKTLDSMGFPMMRSYFADLPFEFAHVVYDPPPLFIPTEESISEDGFAHLGGYDHLGKRLHDRFTFRVFTLSHKHARMINSMLLENSHGRIVFLDIIPLYKSVLAYSRDMNLEHKTDYAMRLKRKLIDAHRMSQITFKFDQGGVDDVDADRLPNPPPPTSSPGCAPSSDSPAQDVNIGTSPPAKKGKKKRASPAGGSSELVNPSPIIRDVVAAAASPNTHSPTLSLPAQTTTTPYSAIKKGRKKRDSRTGGDSSEPVNPSPVIPDVVTASVAASPSVHPPSSPAQTTPTPSSPTKKGKKKRGSRTGVDGSEPVNPSYIIPGAATNDNSPMPSLPVQTTTNASSSAQKGKKKRGSRGNRSVLTSPSPDVIAVTVGAAASHKDHSPTPSLPARTTVIASSSTIKGKKKRASRAGSGSEPVNPSVIPDVVGAAATAPGVTQSTADLGNPFNGQASADTNGTPSHLGRRRYGKGKAQS